MLTLVLSFLLAAQEPDLVITAARVWTGDELIEVGVVRVRAGKIVGLGSALPIPESAERIDLPEGIVLPGHVLLAARLGVRRDEPADPEPGSVRRADEWVHLERAELEAAWSQGWTTAQILPPKPIGVVVGEATVLKLRPEGNVPDRRLPQDRRMIVIEMGARERSGELEAFGRLRSSAGGLGQEWIEDVRSGRASLGLMTAVPGQLSRLLGWCDEVGLEVRWVGGPGARGSTERMAIVPAEVWPVDPSGMLLPWCWQDEPPALRDPRWQQLRLGNALRLNEGDRSPAHLLGLEDRIGKIALGRDADLVIYDGPLEAAGTRVAVTLIEGHVVYRAAKGSPVR